MLHAIHGWPPAGGPGLVGLGTQLNQSTDDIDTGVDIGVGACRAINHIILIVIFFEEGNGEEGAKFRGKAGGGRVIAPCMAA